MRRTRKRLIEVIRTINCNDRVVPFEVREALLQMASALESSFDPPHPSWIIHLQALQRSNRSSWYMKDLLQDCLWHLEHCPWSGPNAL